MSGVQFWSEIIVVISNRTRAAGLRDLEINTFRPNCTPLSPVDIIKSVPCVIYSISNNGYRYLRQAVLKETEKLTAVSL